MDALDHTRRTEKRTRRLARSAIHRRLPSKRQQISSQRSASEAQASGGRGGEKGYGGSKLKSVKCFMNNLAYYSQKVHYHKLHFTVSVINAKVEFMETDPIVNYVKTWSQQGAARLASKLVDGRGKEYFVRFS